MKLATYKDGSRDGQLVVVSRDLSLAHYATGVASKLQQVLDDWNFMSPQLQDISDALNQSGQGRARHAFPFEPARCMAPLPRAYQWVADSHPGASDGFLGPHDPILLPDAQAVADWGVDFEAGVAVITGDVPQGASPAQALDGVRLVMLANDVSLRLRHGDKLGAAFSPVAVTPDELASGGESQWRGGRMHLPLHITWNGRKVGLLEVGAGTGLGFGALISRLCQTRRVRAGSVIGSGAMTGADSGQGYGSIAEKRALDALSDGQAPTPYMALGDTVRVEVKGKDGVSVFGAIHQSVAVALADAALAEKP